MCLITNSEHCSLPNPLPMMHSVHQPISFSTSCCTQFINIFVSPPRAACPSLNHYHLVLHCTSLTQPLPPRIALQVPHSTITSTYCIACPSLIRGLLLEVHACTQSIPHMFPPFSSSACNIPSFKSPSTCPFTTCGSSIWCPAILRLASIYKPERRKALQDAGFVLAGEMQDVV